MTKNLGVVLGGMFEAELRRGLVQYQGNFFGFFSRPIFAALFLVTVLSLMWPWLSAYIKKRKGASA